ncbi:MAG: hypothetical protein EHM61_14150 [Acidobacteria bacterium]|nr:MAG: hypothetical protein EHM61_14150 [Acidobacteriota bacterium]
MNRTPKWPKHAKNLLLARFVCLAATVVFAWATVMAEGWIKLGPEGGSIPEFAQSSTMPGSIYVGTDSGVFRSIDAGANWESTNQGLGVISIGTLTVAPSDPLRLYGAGGGVGFITGDQLNTIYRTTNGGGSWHALRLPSSGSARPASPHRIVVDPLDPDIVYIACDLGILKSTDAGEAWTIRNVGIDATCSVFDLMMGPPATVLAATTCGPFKSTDSGESWRLSSSGMAQTSGSPPSIMDLVVHPLDSCLVWARSGSSIWRSTDCGGTWSELPKPESLSGFLSVTPHILEKTTLYGNTPNAVYRTTDGGQSWSLRASLAGVVPTIKIWADQVDPDTLWLGTSLDGLFRSTDGGSTWHARNSGLTAISISGVSVDPRDSNVVYAGTHLKTIDGGRNWIELCTTGPRLCYWAGATSFPGTPVRMVIDPGTPDTLYLPIREGVIKSHDGGAFWAVVGTGLAKNHTPWLVPDPVRSGVLYASGGGLFKTTDGALTFQPLNAFPSPFAITYDVAVDWHDPNLLYAVSLDGLSTSTDGGQTWTLSGQGLNTGFGGLEADPSRRGTVYAADDGLWRSVDAGSNWTQILPDPGLQIVTIDRVNSRRLFAYSTSSGVIRSLNGGASWVPVNLGLPRFGDGVVPVNGIAIGVRDPSVVYLATAQGVFKLKDQSRRPRPRR